MLVKWKLIWRYCFTSTMLLSYIIRDLKHHPLYKIKMICIRGWLKFNYVYLSKKCDVLVLFFLFCCHKIIIPIPYKLDGCYVYIMKKYIPINCILTKLELCITFLYEAS